MSVEISHLCKYYGTTKALDDVSLTIADGEFLAILGPSGCGKTTLLRSIAGFARPTGGTISSDGTLYSSGNVMVPTEDRKLGMVFQSFALWPHMKVRENVEFPLKSKRNAGLTAAQREDKVKDTLEAVGLREYSERYPDELSGGQKQRVALARAIVERPRLLLMDEPLSALDAALKLDMRAEIQNIHHMTGATIVYVTHDQSEAMAMADRILIMRNGKIEQIGTPWEIYFHPATEFAATFVSKCNLFPGRWEGDAFYIQRDGEWRIFANRKVSGTFHREQVLPLRPDELIFSGSNDGVPGRIINRQFAGQSFIYKVKCAEEIYTVRTDSGTLKDEGEETFLKAV